MDNPFMVIKDISKNFGDFSALKQIDFSLEKKEFVCLLGPSGCGKTTLLRIIGGLEKPSQGKIVLEGRDITSLPPSQRNFGIVFQSYALFPNMTAYENIAYGFKSRKTLKREVEERVMDSLALVGLEDIKNRYPAQLSGGQQQRIALARALVLSPSFLLLDEPLSALDAKVRIKLRSEIRNLQEKIGVTTIMVTHDQEEAITMADKIVVMNNACVEQIGSPQEIYENPNTPFVADFIGSINFVEKDQLIAIRPEHIRILGKDDLSGERAVVKHSEFHGSFYRMKLQLIEDGKELGTSFLTVDIPANVVRGRGIEQNMILPIELPQDRILNYENYRENYRQIIAAG
jgi:ABC-type spermidine/putrescine transport systems, ATPase components